MRPTLCLLSPRSSRSVRLGGVLARLWDQHEQRAVGKNARRESVCWTVADCLATWQEVLWRRPALKTIRLHRPWGCPTAWERPSLQATVTPQSQELVRPRHCDGHAPLGPPGQPTPGQDACVRAAEQCPSRGPREDRKPHGCVRWGDQGDVVGSKALKFPLRSRRPVRYGCLAGYEGANDAVRRVEGPSFRMLAPREWRETSVVLRSTLHWLDAEVLAEQNFRRLSRLNAALMRRDAPWTRLCCHWFRDNEMRELLGGNLLLPLSTP